MDIKKTQADNVRESQTTGAQNLQRTKGTQKTKATEGIGSLVESAGVNNSENVMLSPEVGMAKEALQIAKNTPDKRADKIAELKAQIRNGTYKADSKKVAEQMIESALQDSLLETTNG